MSEDQLQSEDTAAPVTIENTETVKVIENPDTGSELATETETTDKTQDSGVNQEAINKAINKKHFEMKEAERRAEAAEAQIAEFKQKQLEDMQRDIGVIPEVPDSFDDNFDQKMRDRDSAIQRQAAFNAQQAALQNQQAVEQQIAQQKQAVELNTKLEAYTKRATEFGISTQELQDAGNIVASHGISNELTVAILGDPDGALITKYLASNLMEIDTLKGMDSYSAAMYIERTVRAKAIALKPKQSSTPDPVSQISGGGVDPDSSRYPLTQGAKFK